MILKAYVVPHPPIILSEVGKGEEKKIQKTIDSMNNMADEILKLRPDTIIITSPHAPSFRDGFYIGKGEKLIGSLSRFGIFDVKEEVDVDNELAKNIMESNTELPLVYSKKYDDGLDHGSLIPIRFIHKKYKDFKILLVGLSGLAGEQHYKLGKLIEQSVKNLGRRAVFIASGDLSHVLKVDGPYGFEKEGPEFDKMILDILSRGALEELFHIPEEISHKAAQCGLKSFQILAGALEPYSVDSRLYSYEGPFGVGYGVLGFDLIKKQDSYVKLAKDTIYEYIKNKIIISPPDDLPKEMMENIAGTFVTLHKNGELRGCIGTINPTKNSIAEEIINNAISSATRDPRFLPVEEWELDDLEISVDVLFQPERIENLSQLDIKKYGVIVSSGYKKGLLLPNIDGIESEKMQVEIALRKAGIRTNEEFTMERFKVIRHE
ncbi:MAG: AmmeMemoRadiSam system protein A [Tissierellia bacterium]|nr:AmmeMemoRadiSam system protein A [Tissierellia bacterium]